jgi:hypothetical protein
MHIPRSEKNVKTGPGFRCLSLRAGPMYLHACIPYVHIHMHYLHALDDTSINLA